MSGQLAAWQLPRGIGEVLDRAAASLQSSQSARLDAEVLLAHVLNTSRAWLRAWSDRPLDRATLKAYYELLDRRRADVPIAYLTGVREFWSLRLAVTPDTLIPRPETETLVELALERLGIECGDVRVADLGTGSGAVALAIAAERPEAALMATDVSAACLEVAQQNAARHGLAQRVVFCRGSWCSPLRQQALTMIVSNPPYVAANDDHLRGGEIRHEPRRALVGGRDGLDAIRTIILQARRCLRARGHLLLEHGPEQGDRVRRLLASAGYRHVVGYRDLSGDDRVSGGIVG